MRFLRHAALLLLLLLLAGGPALRAAPQSGCSPQRSHCPMCEHRVKQMPCMSGHSVHARVLAEATSLEAVVEADNDCFCGQMPASQVEQAQTAPSSRVDQAPALAVVVEPAWPSVRELASSGAPANVPAGMLVVRSSITAPLRV